MPRLRWLNSARSDLLAIIDYVSRESGSRKTGEHFAMRLRARCRELATLPATLGVSRSELGPDIRSLPFGRYVILLRYSAGTLEIVNIVEGHRNIERLLRLHPNGDED